MDLLVIREQKVTFSMISLLQVHKHNILKAVCNALVFDDAGEINDTNENDDGVGNDADIPYYNDDEGEQSHLENDAVMEDHPDDRHNIDGPYSSLNGNYDEDVNGTDGGIADEVESDNMSDSQPDDTPTHRVLDMLVEEIQDESEADSGWLLPFSFFILFKRPWLMFTLYRL